MAQTTSTGAKKIQDSDNWRDIFADHNDTVDAYDGVITGTVSVITGTTNNSGHTIAAGEYFIANGSKYKATASIPSNTAWASSATAVSDIDIINSLNSAIKTVSTNLGSASSASSVTGADAFSKIDALNGKIANFVFYKDYEFSNVGTDNNTYAYLSNITTKTGYIPIGYVIKDWTSASDGFAVMLTASNQLYVSANKNVTIATLKIRVYYLKTAVGVLPD
jgi:hypothetical protein